FRIAAKIVIDNGEADAFAAKADLVVVEEAALAQGTQVVAFDLEGGIDADAGGLLRANRGYRRQIGEIDNMADLDSPRDKLAERAFDEESRGRLHQQLAPAGVRCGWRLCQNELHLHALGGLILVNHEGPEIGCDDVEKFGGTAFGLG